MKEIQLLAPDIGCVHCAAAIKRSLGATEGISCVSVSVEAKTIRLQYDDGDALDRAFAALADIGYPATRAE